MAAAPGNSCFARALRKLAINHGGQGQVRLAYARTLRTFADGRLGRHSVLWTSSRSLRVIPCRTGPAPGHSARRQCPGTPARIVVPVVRRRRCWNGCGNPVDAARPGQITRMILGGTDDTSIPTDIFPRCYQIPIYVEPGVSWQTRAMALPELQSERSLQLLQSIWDVSRDRLTGQAEWPTLSGIRHSLKIQRRFREGEPEALLATIPAGVYKRYRGCRSQRTR